MAAPASSPSSVSNSQVSTTHSSLTKVDPPADESKEIIGSEEQSKESIKDPVDIVEADEATEKLQRYKAVYKQYLMSKYFTDRKISLVTAAVASGFVRDIALLLGEAFGWKELGEALLLMKVWARKRSSLYVHDCLSGFLITIIMAYLASKSVWRINKKRYYNQTHYDEVRNE